jgi:hypothetical protein
MNVIYTLSDPRTGEVRYVGKTCSRLSLRLWQHIRAPKNTHKDCWIKSLLSIGIKPQIDELESFPDDVSWQAAEEFWIVTLKFLGCRLTNLDSGGRGGKRLTLETRLKMSRSRIGKPSPLKGRKLSLQSRNNVVAALRRTLQKPETLQKMRARMTGIRLSADTRAKIAARATGRKLSQEHRDAISVAKRGIKLPPRSEAHCAAITARQTGRKLAPDHVANMSKALRGRKLTESHRAAISAGLNRRRLNKISSTELATVSDGNSGSNKTTA